ncbi:MAG: exo-alpha-sialidase [Clostridia bacterium]|nr:exo-alpha-sialidase [Clostridia bacterium]
MSELTNAGKQSCEIIWNPTDEKYTNEHIRHFQGCPTIAVTRGGRIFMGWYSGGRCEPHMENFNLIVKSDDGGETWSKPIVVIPSSMERWVQSLDIQLWIDPDGRFHVFWVQNNTHPVGQGKDGYTIDGWVFGDPRHTEWEMICENPDADELTFTEPRMLDIGFLRCKPLVTKSGRWINFNYDQMTDRYGYSISDDKGATWTRRYGAKKIATPFDEGMAYQKENGDIRMLARTSIGELAETTSHDDGLTWDETIPSGIDSPNTHFYIARTPSGRVLMINNDHRTSRCNMTVYLSEDDGVTWKYKRLIDGRNNLSYPDVEFHNGEIYLTYDRERTGAMEILFTRFTEADIMDESYSFDVKIVSKP